MSKPIERALMTCLIAALPLALAPGAHAQSDDSTLSGGPKRMKVPGVEATAEGTAAAEAEAAEETPEVLPEAETSVEAESGADATVEILPEAEPEEPTEVQVFPEGDAIDGQTAQTGTEAEPAAEAEVEAEAEAGADKDVVVTNQAGTGPFVGDYTIGDPEAPVQVVEYASFTCPHCAAYHVEAWPDLKADFIDTGKIGFTMRDVYFDRFGLWASMTARCGGEAAFYPIAGQFLAKQKEWTGADDIAGAIAQIGRRNGLTDEQLKVCLENQDFAKLLVEEYQTNAAADEVRSTPTFLIRGPDGTETVVGNNPDGVRTAIEQALSGS